MKRYIRSDDRLPQLYQYWTYRLQVGDEVLVSGIWGDPVNLQGIICDIYDDTIYIVPKDLYVEGKKDYSYTYDIDLDADGLNIELISTNYRGRQIKEKPWRVQQVRTGELDENEEDDI